MLQGPSPDGFFYALEELALTLQPECFYFSRVSAFPVRLTLPGKIAESTALKNQGSLSEDYLRSRFCKDRLASQILTKTRSIAMDQLIKRKYSIT